jgi:[calcium/calmodulin-dependent protein kinase] kinase
VFRKSQLRKKKELIKDENGKSVMKDALMDTIREISIMKELEHVNTIRLHEVIEQ